jgi:putative hydrolase of the HAD superfamily
LRYQQLIFDVDDTLIDFEKTEKYVLQHLFADEHWPLTPQTERDYHDYNQSLWRKLEKQEITLHELMNLRFAHFARREWGIMIDNREANYLFHYYWGQTHALMPDVRKLLKTAQHLGYQLAVLSNGIQAEQVKRLTEAGILPYFEPVVTSQIAGQQKPAPQVFDYFFKLAKFPPQTSLMIGDGLPSDIAGAQNYGIDSVWYNYRQRRGQAGIQPTYTVTDYSQLIHLLKKWTHKAPRTNR